MACKDTICQRPRINHAESARQPEPTRRMALNCIVGGRRLAVFSSLLSRLHTGALIHCTLFAVKRIMKEKKKVLSVAFRFPTRLAVLHTILLSAVVNLSSAQNDVNRLNAT